MDWLNCKYSDYVIPPEKAHLYDPVSECPFPLEELWPPYYLSKEELDLLDEQLQRIVAK
jgi:hypothetical protein